jgi:hypothetical protein
MYSMRTAFLSRAQSPLAALATAASQQWLACMLQAILALYTYANAESSGSGQGFLTVALSILCFIFKKTLLSFTDPINIDAAMLIAGSLRSRCSSMHVPAACMCLVCQQNASALCQQNACSLCQQNACGLCRQNACASSRRQVALEAAGSKCAQKCCSAWQERDRDVPQQPW